MKLINSTDYSDAFLRRMVSWCCKQIGLPSRHLRRATFRNLNCAGYSGHGGSGVIVVRIGSEDRFPAGDYERFGVRHPVLADRLEGLVGTTAHEVYHCWQTANGSLGRSSHNEPAAYNAEESALRAFRANKEALLAEWSAVPLERQAADLAPRPSVIEKRAAKASADLARWMRKLKLAQTKVKKLKRRVAYYAAARQS